MIVIDVGCARYGDDYSVERLIEEFQPRTLYGFDPNAETWEKSISGTWVDQRCCAAWTYDGEIGYRQPGLRGSTTDDPDAPRVECIDLARFINELPADETVLKLDCEGCEYTLLEYLIGSGIDKRLELAIVEWHNLADRSHGERRAKIEDLLRCDLREWEW